MQSPEGCNGSHYVDSLELPLKSVPHTPQKKMDLFLSFSGRSRVNTWFEREEIGLGICGFIDRSQPEAVAQMETCDLRVPSAPKGRVLESSNRLGQI